MITETFNVDFHNKFIKFWNFFFSIFPHIVGFISLFTLTHTHTHTDTNTHAHTHTHTHTHTHIYIYIYIYISFMWFTILSDGKSYSI